MAKEPLPQTPSIKQVAELLSPARARAGLADLTRRHAKVVDTPPNIEPAVRIDVVRQPRREPLMIARGEIVVRGRDARRAAKVLGARFTPSEPDGRLGLVTFRGTVGAGAVLEAVRRLRTHCIEASPNTVLACGMRSKSHVTPEKTHLRALPTASSGNAGSGAHVVVIDTGIDAGAASHALLAGIPIDTGTPGNVDPLTAINIRENGQKLLDLAAGHGTFVAGVVRAMAPKCAVTMIRALDSDGVGTATRVAEAILEAASLQPDVINMSFGAEDPDHTNPIAVLDAMLAARKMSPTTVFVAAAGNSPDGVRTWPATLPGVVAVAGLAPGNSPSAWSKRGAWIDVSALGEGVVSTFVRGTESPDADPTPDTWTGKAPLAEWTGTSFAAPRVAGAIAAGVSNGLSPTAALKKLVDGGTPTPDWGVVLDI